MKTILLTTFALLFASFMYAQDGFVSLFDGKSLKGWTSSTDKPESFSVEDGMMIVKGGRAHIFYSGSVGSGSFKNFELKLRARTTKGSNSGVYFHTKYQEDGWPSIGFEAQVNSTHTDPKKTGSLYGIANIFVPPAGQAPFITRINANKEMFIAQAHAPSIDDEWFDYHIIVNDNKITLKVNGKTTVEWTQPKDWDREGRRIGEGTIAFQAHDPKSEVHYKDIRIKLLK